LTDWGREALCKSPSSVLNSWKQNWPNMYVREWIGLYSWTDWARRPAKRRHYSRSNNYFFYIFFSLFSKINGPLRQKICNYTSTAVGDDGRGPTTMPHGGCYNTPRGCTLATATAVEGQNLFSKICNFFVWNRMEVKFI
jgi:hypothetical protein